jgi:hypothetical protein
MSRTPAPSLPDGTPIGPAPGGPVPRDPPDGPVSDKDAPGTGTSLDPRTPYGPDEGPPVGEAVDEDSEAKPPVP